MSRTSPFEVTTSNLSKAASCLVLLSFTGLAPAVQAQVVACEVQALFQPDDLFGHTLAAEGNWLAVSRDFTAFDGNFFVYQRVNDEWMFTQEITLSNGANVNEGMLMKDGSLFISSFGSGGLGGEVHVYTESGGLWNEQAVLTAPDTSLGFSLSLDGDTLAAGAPFEDRGIGTNTGGVYLFHRTGSTWQAGDHLVAGDPHVGDEFGRSVTLRGDTLMAGAPGLGIGAGGSGGVYVFQLTNGQWSQEQKITQSGVSRLGEEVLFDGDSALLAGPDLGRGVVLVYEQVGGSWQEQQRLESSNTDLFRLGRSLSVLGDRLAAGAVCFAQGLGAAVIFERAAGSSGPWLEVTDVAAVYDEVDSFVDEQPSVVLIGDQLAIGTSAAGGAFFDEDGSVSIFDLVPAPANYCTAKTNSLGCAPMATAASATGFAEAFSFTPFDVGASMVLNARNGLLFYGTTGAAAIPFNGGLLCVQPPLRRTGFQNAFGSSPPTQDCSGTYTFDFNERIRSGVDATLVAGTTVSAQYWTRDPNQLDGTGVGLTDAVEFVICP